MKNQKLLFYTPMRKFQENRQRTENRQTENSKPEATLIPVDRRGERANFMRTDRQTDREQRTESREQKTENSKPEATLIPVDSRGERANYWSTNFEWG